MKKLYFMIVSFLVLVGLGFMLSNTTYAAQQYGYVDRNTFILNAGNDLGKIIPKGTYYTPRIPYTDGNAVKNQFIKNLTFPGDFYSSRNITKSLLNNESPYFSVGWDKPFYVKSLSGIKRVLKGYLFAYRKDGKDIYWMDAKNFTPAFLAGYESKENQSIIIYPIRSKQTKKVVAFLQYPCGNLVCRDTSCSDLKVRPVCGDGIVNREVGEVCDPKDPKTRRGCSNTCKYKELSCEVYNSNGNIDDFTRPSIKVKKESNVEIKEYFLNRQKFSNYSDINKKPLAPGKYTVNAMAVNKYSGKQFLCKGDDFYVEDKQYCGDGKVSGNEECDYKDPNNNGSCSKTCKFTDISCSASVKATKLEEPSRLSEVIKVRKSDNTKISKITLNGKDVTSTNPMINKDGEYKIGVTVRNAYSKKTASCETKLKFDTREYCGDGKMNGYEQCDDGGNVDGDGCSKTCRLERPTCKISRKVSTLVEGQPFSNYVGFDYTGKFETAVINNDKVYNSMEELLTNTVPKNLCKTRTEISYTVSNPLDPNMTRTCKTTFNTKNKEYCGDGIVQKNEQCDPDDPVTGLFCEKTCRFKKTNECHILNNSFTAGQYGTIALETEYFVLPSKLSINGKNISGRNGIFKYKFTTPGEYQVTALMLNKADTRKQNPSYCTFNIKVAENQCKANIGRTSSNSGLFNFFR